MALGFRFQVLGVRSKALKYTYIEEINSFSNANFYSPSFLWGQQTANLVNE